MLSLLDRFLFCRDRREMNPCLLESIDAVQDEAFQHEGDAAPLLKAGVNCFQQWIDLNA